jgi:CRISPR-associated endonuclease/helicase Cas3
MAFVVDRRVVVDEAFLHAKALAEALRVSTDPVIGEVAARLRRFSGSDNPLAVALLRGGMHRDERWAASPCQPTVVVSTVDQVGSRLLFRGYGIPPRSRPIHAGLLGIDTRVILDESHLSAPFEDTVGYVARVQAAAPEGSALPPPLAITTMTATPRAEDRFLLTAADLENETLMRRLRASKPATARITHNLESEATEQAIAWANDGQVVGVVLNRVASARAVFETVRQDLGDDRCLLLTGRARPAERDELVERWRGRIFARPGRQSESVVVVATQTIEVGANLDFDRLVTELAPLDSLRQRFGRLNRLGNHGSPCPALIVARRESVAGKKAGADPVYGDRLPAVWSWITTAGDAKSKDSWEMDFGVEALAQRLARSAEDASLGVRALTEALSSAAPRCPVVLPTHIDAWAQTCPAPVPDAPIAPYLHGPEAFEVGDVQVVWRADLTAEPKYWKETVAAVPPKVMEALPLPRSAVLRWLAAGDAPPLADVAIVAPAGELSAEKVVLRWSGGPEDAEIVQATKIQPGDTVVVPAAYGGVDQWGWNPGRVEPVKDLGDMVSEGGVRRLHPQLLDDTAQGDRVRLLYERRSQPDLARSERNEIDSEIAAFFGVQVEHCKLVRYARLDGGDSPIYALLAQNRRARDEFGDDDDSTAIASPALLEEHSAGVAKTAGDFARRCGPAEWLVGLLERAGWLHDIGKADGRMQAWLGEGVVEPGRYLAKSGMNWRDRRRNRFAREAAGYPPGARHELQSVALVLSVPDVLADTRDRELAIHLIGAHHGYGRGLAPVVEDPGAVDVSILHGGVSLSASSAHGLERLDSGWADRFWHLHREYGPWGLAWLEAVLRLADHRVSEHEAQGGEA